MDYLYEDFRNARVILEMRAAWVDLDRVIRSISAADIEAKHQVIARARGSAPAGGQTAVNAVFEDRLLGVDGWRSQARLFRSIELRKWTMDFLRQSVGVEISFNHAEAIPWQFTRLNIAGESDRVLPDSRIDVGVVICSTRSFKAWARMDSAVGTFDAFRAWLREMRPILPVPLLLVGLDAEDWPRSTVFRGTATGTRKALGAVDPLLGSDATLDLLGED